MAWIGREVVIGLALGLVLLGSQAGATQVAPADAPPPVGDTGPVRAEIHWTAGWTPTAMVGTGGPPETPATADGCGFVVKESAPPKFEVYCEVPEGVECAGPAVEASQVWSRLGGVSASATCREGEDRVVAACSFEAVDLVAPSAGASCRDEATGARDELFVCHAQPWDLSAPHGSVTCNATYRAR